MLYAVICIDKPDSTDLRSSTRQAHLDFLKENAAAIKLGGPMLDEGESAMIGSLIIIDADSLEAAKALMARDPYAGAGLFQSVDIRPWKWTVNAPDAKADL